MLRCHIASREASQEASQKTSQEASEEISQQASRATNEEARTSEEPANRVAEDVLYKEVKPASSGRPRISHAENGERRARKRTQKKVNRISAAWTPEECQDLAAAGSSMSNISQTG